MYKYSFIVKSEYTAETLEILSQLQLTVEETSITDFGMFDVIGTFDNIETLKKFLSGDNTVI